MDCCRDAPEEGAELEVIFSNVTPYEPGQVLDGFPSEAACQRGIISVKLRICFFDQRAKIEDLDLAKQGQSDYGLYSHPGFVLCARFGKVEALATQTS